jgi:chlorobactene glucosyltransferase
MSITSSAKVTMAASLSHFFTLALVNVMELLVGFESRIGIPPNLLHRASVTIPMMENMVILILEILSLLLLLYGLINVIRNTLFMRTIRTGKRVETRMPRVSILVPARNEVANIESCIRSLLNQDYPTYEVIVLDDDSTDGTGGVLERMARGDQRLRVLHVHDPLPPDWNGKSRACQRLADAAHGDWLLFTDADTRHAPQALHSAMAQALSSDVSLFTGVPRQITASWGERLFVPVAYILIYNGVNLPRYYRSADSGITGAAAIGQYILVQREAYIASGGHRAIKGKILDDVWLAQTIKRHGYRILFTYVADFVSCRMYHGFGETCRGFSKNAFAVLGGSLPAALVFSLGALLFFQFPLAVLPSTLFNGVTVTGFVLPMLMVTLTVSNAILVCRLIGQPWWVGLLYPISTWIGLGILFNSVQWRYIKGGVAWKGRIMREK